jgi:hypothetical protein
MDVRKKARPESSMVKGHTIEEALSFCTKYLQDFIATKQRVWDGKEDMFMVDKVVEENGHPWKLSVDLRNMAHSFILQNVELMGPWCL